MYDDRMQIVEKKKNRRKNGKENEKRERGIHVNAPTIY